MTTLSQTFEPLGLSQIHDAAARRAADGWRYVQILAVNTEDGVDLVYSFMKDGLLENLTVAGVKEADEVPSITDLFLEAFVCENEIHDLYGVTIRDIAIDFGGMFYQLSQKAPMTVVSPEQLAAREKAKKIAAAKAAKEAAAKTAAAAPATPAGPTEEEIQAKIAGLDPDKAAKVRAAMEAKAKKAAAQASEVAPTAPAPAGPTEEEIQAKIAGLDPEKAAKVRAALEAKARKAAKTEGKGE
ncbi:NADH-quinone oxidoreductase subunit C [Adlercreutzia sp. R7]|uniref:NADH-quinone oxidoreductase subunit C n=1 Tax=Adlercreutzia wanghongyangiae TaxID=3111451 RepID=A0ABU6IHF6_9ACTN|nr:NADH-quinone oxidoreductase subunit C [Adlercreutzia sp. R7]